MTTPYRFDPFDMWRQAVTKMEEGVNNLGNQTLGSDELSRALLEFSTVSIQMQHMLEKLLSQYFKTVNLPSRKDIVELGDTMRRIEEKIDRLLPAVELAERPRPARTRRPPEPATIGATPAATTVRAATPPATTSPATAARTADGGSFRAPTHVPKPAAISAGIASAKPAAKRRTRKGA